VTVSAVVVGDFQYGDDDQARNLGGFFLQEEASDYDDNDATSEGIYIYEGSGNTTKDVKLGDLVQVTGVVGEYKGQTQITAKSITISSSGNPLPPKSTITFPKSSIQLEAFEGMHVVISDTMTITDMYNLARYGEIRLFAKDRTFSYTQSNLPGNATGYAAHVEMVNMNSMSYENGLTTQNVDVSLLDGFGPVFNTATSPRMGDKVNGLTGILEYASKWKIRSTVNGENTFIKTNMRPLIPPDVSGGVPGAVKIASLNVLNMFNTLAADGATTGPPPGVEPRGANSVDEYNRQLEKLVTIISAMDADLLGMLELENDFGAVKGDNCTLKTVVEAVNAKVGAGIYDYVWPGGRYVDTGDAISVGMMYKPAIFSMVGAPGILTDSNLPAGAPAPPIFEGVNTNRVSLAVSFTHGGDCVTVAALHFKSKGGTGSGEGNTDKKDGAGSWNKRRLDAATAVTMWMDTVPTGYSCSNTILMGDLNSCKLFLLFLV
jgi:predicted extracellular nuclease